MFAVGDYVMKINNGICKIDDITRLNMSGIDKSKMYYVMTPVDKNKSTLYVSVETADKNIRYAMSKDAAESVINSIESIECVSIENDKFREQKYKDALKSGNPEELVSVIKTICKRRKVREEMGKKNTAIDERYFKQAEELLCSEIAFALNTEKNSITDRINTIVSNVIL